MEAFQLFVSLQLIDNFSRQLAGITQKTKEFENSIKKVGSSLKDLQENLWNFSEKIENGVIKTTTAVGGISAAIGKTLSAFEDTEAARVQMEVAFMTKTGLPEELKTIDQQVSKLGTELPGATKDFYELSTALKAGGLSAKEIAGGILEGTARAWVLFKNEVNPAQMADYATKFANSFKIDPTQFTEFIDELQRLKFASGMELKDIAYSTKYFANYLQQLGLTGMNSVKLIFPMLGTLRQFGLEGETAGTAIGNMLKGITEFDNKVGKLKDVKINLRAKDYMTPEGFKLEEFLISLRQELDKIQDPMKKIQTMKELFGDEGMRAVGAMLVKNKEEALAYLQTIKETLSPEEYEALRKQIEEGGFSGLEGMRKAMDEQAALQDRINRTMNTFANIKESFFGTLEGLMAIVGEIFAEPLKNILDSINNNVLSPLGDWIKANKELIKPIAYLIGGISLFGLALAGIGLALASVIKFASFTVGAYAKFYNALKIAILWTKAKAGALWLKTVALYQNMVALIRWAITGQATTGWLKALDFLLLKTKLRLLEAITVIRLKIATLLQWSITMSRVAFAHVLSGLKALIIAFRSLTLAMLANPLVLAISAVVVAVWVLWKNWDRVVKLLSSGWNWLKQNWQKLANFLLSMNPFHQIIMAVNNLVKRLYGVSLFDAGVKIVNTLLQGIKSMASKPVEIFKEIVQKIRNMLPFSPAKEGPLKDIHRIRLVETIAESVKPDPLVSKFTTALSSMATLKNPVVSIKTMVESIAPNPPPLKQKVVHIADKFTQHIAPAIQKVKQVIEPAAQLTLPLQNVSVMKQKVSVETFRTSVLPPLTQKVKQLSEPIKQTAPQVIQKVKQSVEAVKGVMPPTVIQKVKQLTEPVKAATPEIVQKIKQVLEPAQTSVMPAVQRIRQVLEPVSIPALPTLQRAYDAQTPRFTTIRAATQQKTNNFTVTVNLGGLHFGEADPAKARTVAAELEKQIRQVLAKIENEHFRRRY